jgi:hypothetical protein
MKNEALRHSDAGYLDVSGSQPQTHRVWVRSYELLAFPGGKVKFGF